MSSDIVPAQTAELVDKRTGEVTEVAEFHGYAGVATVALDADQAAALAAPIPDEDHAILPTGEVYVSQVHYRRTLNKVFGPGGWAMVPRGGYVREGNTICREYALVGPGGRFLSEAIGEAEYQPNNARMSYASACEAAKSNALTRCCKDLGIASECWDKRFCEEFKSKFCVKVWRAEVKRRDGSKGEFQWRRKDDAAFYDEKGAPADQPAATGPQEARPAAKAPAGQTDGSRSGCPHCGDSCKPSQFPKPGATHYCHGCKKAFDPADEQ